MGRVEDETPDAPEITSTVTLLGRQAMVCPVPDIAPCLMHSSSGQSASDINTSPLLMVTVLCVRFTIRSSDRGYDPTIDPFSVIRTRSPCLSDDTVLNANNSRSIAHIILIRIKSFFFIRSMVSNNPYRTTCECCTGT